MKAISLALACLLLAVHASAQTGVPVSYRADVVPAGAGNPLTAPAIGGVTIPYSVGICNQAPFATPPPAVEVNPTRFAWADPVNTNQICVSQQTAFFTGLPRAGTATTAGYVYRLSATNADGTTASTTVSNGFSLTAPSNPPGVPAGVQVRP